MSWVDTAYHRVRYLREATDAAHGTEECSGTVDGIYCEKCAHLQVRWEKFYRDLPRWVLLLFVAFISVRHPSLALTPEECKIKKKISFIKPMFYLAVLVVIVWMAYRSGIWPTLNNLIGKTLVGVAH